MEAFSDRELIKKMEEVRVRWGFDSPPEPEPKPEPKVKDWTKGVTIQATIIETFSGCPHVIAAFVGCNWSRIGYELEPWEFTAFEQARELL